MYRSACCNGYTPGTLSSVAFWPLLPLIMRMVMVVIVDPMAFGDPLLFARASAEWGRAAAWPWVAVGDLFVAPPDL